MKIFLLAVWVYLLNPLMVAILSNYLLTFTEFSYFVQGYLSVLVLICWWWPWKALVDKHPVEVDKIVNRLL